jgi:hypothetical protein
MGQNQKSLYFHVQVLRFRGVAILLTNYLEKKICQQKWPIYYIGPCRMAGYIFIWGWKWGVTDYWQLPKIVTNYWQMALFLTDYWHFKVNWLLTKFLQEKKRRLFY